MNFIHRILSQFATYPWWVWVFVAAVFGVIVYGGYLFWYHVIQYPNGKPEKR
jgi:hypothetical protein